MQTPLKTFSPNMWSSTLCFFNKAALHGFQPIFDTCAIFHHTLSLSKKGAYQYLKMVHIRTFLKGTLPNVCTFISESVQHIFIQKYFIMPAYIIILPSNAPVCAKLTLYFRVCFCVNYLQPLKLEQVRLYQLISVTRSL